MPNTDEIVEAFDASISVLERGWTQSAYARNSEGEAVESDSQSAVCWCALGAISQNCASWTTTIVVLKYVGKQLPSNANLIEFNDRDSRTADEVIAVFKKAKEDYLNDVRIANE